MKYVFKVLIGLLIIPMISSAQSSSLSGNDIVLSGKDAFAARMKTTCNTTQEGKTIYGMFEGKSYSRVPGEKDRHLFNVVGINVRQCDKKVDETRGDGYRSVSREIMIYLDPKTNEIMDVWTNPWTGEEVEVVHVANDPVNMRGYRYEKDEKGNDSPPFTLRNYGDLAFTSHEIPLYYDNPLGSDFQVYIGGAYHAMEIFNTAYYSEEISDRNIKDLSQSNLTWSRVAQWLPWMQMGDKAGIMVFNATGMSTFDEGKIWPALQKVLDERYPLYKTPPPLDDPRPNETSWTVFKKYMEDKKPTSVRQKHGGRH